MTTLLADGLGRPAWATSEPYVAAVVVAQVLPEVP